MIASTVALVGTLYILDRAPRADAMRLQASGRRTVE
jgi:hypothetical protein